VHSHDVLCRLGHCPLLRVPAYCSWASSALSTASPPPFPFFLHHNLENAKTKSNRCHWAASGSLRSHQCGPGVHDRDINNDEHSQSPTDWVYPPARFFEQHLGRERANGREERVKTRAHGRDGLLAPVVSSRQLSPSSRAGGDRTRNEPSLATSRGDRPLSETGRKPPCERTQKWRDGLSEPDAGESPAVG